MLLLTPLSQGSMLLAEPGLEISLANVASEPDTAPQLLAVLQMPREELSMFYPAVPRGRVSWSWSTQLHASDAYEISAHHPLPYPSSPKTLSTLVPWAQGSGQQQALVLEERRSRFSALPPVLGWPDTSAPGGPLTHRVAAFIGLTS